MLSGVSILFVFVLLLHEGSAFKYWRRFKYTPAEEAHTLVVLKRFTSSPLVLDSRNRRLAETDQPKRYSAVDLASSGKFADRYEPLCRVFFIEPIETDPLPGPDESVAARRFTCSCSFVKRNVVMLAAHCFYTRESENGPLIDLRPSNNFYAYVVRQYGKYGSDTANHVKHTLENAYAAVEWWTPREFKGTLKGMDSMGRHADIAFIKLRGSNVKTTYTLMPRTGMVREMLKPKGYDIENLGSVILGYPVGYMNGEAAVSVTGSICPKPTDENAAADEQKQKKKKQGSVLELTTALKDGESVGGMGRGGSGGPWILANDVVEQPEWSKLRMAVFSAMSTGAKDEEDDTYRCSQGSEVTVEIIAALNRIASLPLAFDSLKERDKAKLVAVRQQDDIGGNDIIRLDLTTTSEEVRKTLKLIFY